MRSLARRFLEESRYVATFFYLLVTGAVLAGAACSTAPTYASQDNEQRPMGLRVTTPIPDDCTDTPVHRCSVRESDGIVWFENIVGEQERLPYCFGESRKTDVPEDARIQRCDAYAYACVRNIGFVYAEDILFEYDDFRQCASFSLQETLPRNGILAHPAIVGGSILPK